MSTRPLVPAIRVSCWRRAFMGTLSPMMRQRDPLSPFKRLFSMDRLRCARPFFTTTVTFWMESGFSRKSKAPSLVAFTAASVEPERHGSLTPLPAGPTPSARSHRCRQPCVLAPEGRLRLHHCQPPDAPCDEIGREHV